jgi:hypothetical protein
MTGSSSICAVFVDRHRIAPNIHERYDDFANIGILNIRSPDFVETKRGVVTRAPINAARCQVQPMFVRPRRRSVSSNNAAPARIVPTGGSGADTRGAGVTDTSSRFQAT